MRRRPRHARSARPPLGIASSFGGGFHTSGWTVLYPTRESQGPGPPCDANLSNHPPTDSRCPRLITTGNFGRSRPNRWPHRIPNCGFSRDINLIFPQLAALCTPPPLMRGRTVSPTDVQTLTCQGATSVVSVVSESTLSRPGRDGAGVIARPISAWRMKGPQWAANQSLQAEWCRASCRQSRECSSCCRRRRG